MDSRGEGLHSSHRGVVENSCGWNDVGIHLTHYTHHYKWHQSKNSHSNSHISDQVKTTIIEICEDETKGNKECPVWHNDDGVK